MLHNSHHKPFRHCPVLHFQSPPVGDKGYVKLTIQEERHRVVQLFRNSLKYNILFFYCWWAYSKTESYSKRRTQSPVRGRQ